MRVVFFFWRSGCKHITRARMSVPTFESNHSARFQHRCAASKTASNQNAEMNRLVGVFEEIKRRYSHCFFDIFLLILREATF